MNNFINPKIKGEIKAWSSLQEIVEYKSKSKEKSKKQPNFLYLYNKNTEEDILINLVPEGVSESYSPIFASQTPFGSINPYFFYIGGTSKTISFSLMIHEDVIEENSLFSLTEKLKNMLLPSFENGKIIGPKVYLQLGNHFAGLGHINISFNFSKPYDHRRGVFKLTQCDLSFTYHEEFEQVDSVFDNILYAKEYTDYSVKLAQSFKNLWEQSGKYTSFDNFLKIPLDYDYMVNYVFASDKTKKLFNTLKLSFSNTGLGSKDTDLLKATFTSRTLIDNQKYFKELFSLNVDEYLVEMYNFHIRFIEIMSPLVNLNPNVTISKLRTLLAELNSFNTTYRLNYTFDISKFITNFNSLTIPSFVYQDNWGTIESKKYKIYTVYPVEGPNGVFRQDKGVVSYIDYPYLTEQYKYAVNPLLWENNLLLGGYYLDYISEFKEDYQNFLYNNSYFLNTVALELNDNDPLKGYRNKALGYLETLKEKVIPYIESKNEDYINNYNKTPLYRYVYSGTTGVPVGSTSDLEAKGILAHSNTSVIYSKEFVLRPYSEVEDMDEVFNHLKLLIENTITVYKGVYKDGV